MGRSRFAHKGPGTEIPADKRAAPSRREETILSRPFRPFRRFGRSGPFRAFQAFRTFRAFHVFRLFRVFQLFHAFQPFHAFHCFACSRRFAHVPPAGVPFRPAREKSPTPQWLAPRPL